jgi:hypothetical protein
MAPGCGGCRCRGLSGMPPIGQERRPRPCRALYERLNDRGASAAQPWLGCAVRQAARAARSAWRERPSPSRHAAGSPGTHPEVRVNAMHRPPAGRQNAAHTPPLSIQTPIRRRPPSCHRLSLGSVQHGLSAAIHAEPFCVHSGAADKRCLLGFLNPTCSVKIC